MIRIYGVPRGGIPASLLVFEWLNQTDPGPFTIMVEDPGEADVFIDDIIDSGKTRDYFTSKFPGRPFCALYEKTNQDEWVEFPWERMRGEQGPEDAVTRLIEYIGDDPNRDGLRDTPERVIRSYSELFAGYQTDPESLITTFDDDSDEMILLKDIEFYSTCEHHLMPFIGKAHIAYIPDGRVVGISKLARILEVYTRRLQIQERICKQMTGLLMKALKPKGAACVLQAKHLCMTARGVNKQQSEMITSSLEGVFLNQQDTREEFFSAIER